MIQGTRVYNNDNQVLISSDIENMHYGGQATHTGSSSSTLEMRNQNFISVGQRIHTFTFVSVAAPLVFIRPDDYNLWYAIIRQSQSGSTWTFEVLQSGTTNATPELHVFVPPSQLPHSTETKGLQVFLGDGTPAFDSRLEPLAIADGGILAPPANPTIGGTPGVTGVRGALYIVTEVGGEDVYNPLGIQAYNQGTMWGFGGYSPGYHYNDWDFRPNEHSNSSTLNTTGIAYTDLMFAAPSLAQSVQKRTANGMYQAADLTWRGIFLDDLLVDIFWYYSTATWWVMYLNAFKITPTHFKSGYAMYLSGYEYSTSTYQQDFTWWWETEDPPQQNTAYGSVPYDPKSINTQANAYLLADVTKYT